MEKDDIIANKMKGRTNGKGCKYNLKAESPDYYCCQADIYEARNKINTKLND